MPTWVIQDNLGRDHRPGYSGEQGRSVPVAEVAAWIEDVRAFGIKSIICLLSDDQLPLYGQLPNGLISHYRAEGFTVEHVPAQDHQHPPLSANHLGRIWAAYQALPKPVLIHCSAGIDRTGLAVSHIQCQLRAMHFRHRDFTFEVDENWWAEAGMTGFVPTSKSYRVDPKAFPNLAVRDIRIDDVAPVRRELSHGVFHDDAETGLPAKDRVVRILRAFRVNVALPPVEIQDLPADVSPKYKLYHGAHRLYLALAAGFTHVPAVDVTER